MTRPAVLPSHCPILLSRKQVAAALGASLRTLDVLTSSGRFPPADVRVGDRPRWTLEAFQGWIDSQTADRNRS
jgi:predicted DNA-binding transcriptional regulator AlpA